ncbi:MAG: hypothetical protein U5K55_16230 [Aliarcobacter sp.]|nr:hypothetical protein [Aliarcobacter sp.]
MVANKGENYSKKKEPEPQGEGERERELETEVGKFAISIQQNIQILKRSSGEKRVTQENRGIHASSPKEVGMLEEVG